MMSLWATPGTANGQVATGQANAPAATTTSSSATGSGSSTTIGANDFLTLLVTEMQNQDPTAATDPNAYVNQLVSINSLEQLISINQNLSSALGTGSGSTPQSGVATAGAAPGTGGGGVASGAMSSAAPRPAMAIARTKGGGLVDSGITGAPASMVPDSGVVPVAAGSANRLGAAASRVGKSLATAPTGLPVTKVFRDIPTHAL